MNNSETDISGQNDPTRTFRPLFGSNLGLHLDGETEDWPRARNGLNVNHSDWTCLAMDSFLGARRVVSLTMKSWLSPRVLSLRNRLRRRSKTFGPKIGFRLGTITNLSCGT